MEQTTRIEDGLQINLQLNAAPAVRLLKNGGNVENNQRDAFAIQVSALLEYATLTRLVNGYLEGQRFDLSEGLFSTYVVVQSTQVASDNQGNLLIRVQFGGSFSGEVIVRARPVLEKNTREIKVANLQYDIQTGSLLLRMAKTLLQNKIRQELLRRTVFPLQPILLQTQAAIQEMLNKEWAAGVKVEGAVTNLALSSVEALPEGLKVEGFCTGRLVISLTVKPLF